MFIRIPSGPENRAPVSLRQPSSNPDGEAACFNDMDCDGVGEVTLMDLSVLCGLLQPFVDLLQSFVSMAYLPLNWIGIGTPPVSSWFQPFLPCTLG